MTIINIRGTSGSGKSTVARDIMALYTGGRRKFFSPERKQPLGYTLNRGTVSKTGRGLAVVGHYETPCGGCDTITSMDRIFDLVRISHTAGYDVLFEGLLISAEVNRMAQLHLDGLPTHVVLLDVPLEECLRSVNERRRRQYDDRLGRLRRENDEREAAGKKPVLPYPEYRGEVNPKNTESKWKGSRQATARLQSLGVSCCTADRGAAVDYIKVLLEI